MALRRSISNLAGPAEETPATDPTNSYIPSSFPTPTLFIESSTFNTPTTLPDTNSEAKGLSAATVISVLAVGAALAIILIFAIIWVNERRKPHHQAAAKGRKENTAVLQQSVITYKSVDGAPTYSEAVPLRNQEGPVRTVTF